MHWVVRERVVWCVVMGVLLLGFCAGRVRAAEPVTARAVVDAEPLVQGGTGRIAVEIEIDPEYHIQSSRPHDKYLIPTRVRMAPSPGIVAGDVRYPVGEDIPGSDGVNSILISAYRGKVYVIVPVKVEADAEVGERTLEVSLRTQACQESACLPPTTQVLKVPVTIAKAGTAARPINAEEFAAADRQAFEAAAATATAASTTSAPATATGPANVVPAVAGAEVPLMSEADQLALIKSRHYRPFNQEQYPLGVIMLLALVGGVILNIMPCVLPVIPLKVLSLVQQAHGDRRLALLHGLTFSAGVISLFIVLAVALKTAGLFYGQQFQSPAFLTVMVLFVVALALSMLGVWTLNPPQALYAAEGNAPHTGYLGSFTNGLMATLLATPCSAPYLGAALAWAFAQPAWLTALTLGLVGVGMSLPYLVLAVFPAALEKLPRAGRWSDLLKQGLGIVMLGVAVYLVTLISNVMLWMWVLMAAVLVGLVCWAWGQLPTYNMERGRIWTIRGIAVCVGAAIGVVLYVLAMRSAVGGPQAELVDQRGWRPFNMALLDDALAHHRPVVVDWTASWCINCHFLEATVLNTEEVEKAFRDRNAVLLKADLSSDNPPATLLNRELGGEAIPVLGIFVPSRPTEPVVLRDIYSKERLIAEIAKAR